MSPPLFASGGRTKNMTNQSIIKARHGQKFTIWKLNLSMAGCKLADVGT